MTDGDRTAELKAAVDKCKAEVRDAQEALEGLKGRAHAGARGGWAEFERAKRRWKNALRALSEAKVALIRVTGTTGSDPRWLLIRDAWRVLNRLQESGIAIGGDGEKLLDEIEFHVPASKLIELEGSGS
jgi:hypothetical protein